MKISIGSITVGSNTETAILNDSSLTPDEVIFSIRGTYSGIPCSSLGTHIRSTNLKACKYNTSSSTTYPIIINNGSNLLQGYVSYWDTGEFDVTFPTRVTGHSYVIDYVAIEY